MLFLRLIGKVLASPLGMPVPYWLQWLILLCGTAQILLLTWHWSVDGDEGTVWFWISKVLTALFAWFLLWCLISVCLLLVGWLSVDAFAAACGILLFLTATFFLVMRFDSMR